MWSGKSKALANWGYTRDYTIVETSIYWLIRFNFVQKSSYEDLIKSKCYFMYVHLHLFDESSVLIFEQYDISALQLCGIVNIDLRANLTKNNQF